jgi:SAM-dependent methyltransferase
MFAPRSDPTVPVSIHRIRERSEEIVTELTIDRPEVDPAHVEAFFGKVFGDVSGMFVTLLASIGDRHGLFTDLHARGPATGAELAARTGIDEHYAREWLLAFASAGYLTYEPASRRFGLPAAHAPVLAEEGGPFFLGGIYQQTIGGCRLIDRVLDVFAKGGGIPLAAYDDDWWTGMERNTAGWFENRLIQQWLPPMPEVLAKLERGALVADVGCGRGRALIKLAQAFPRSRFVGYDVVERSIAAATASAAVAGVAGRVRFERRDAHSGLPETFDIVTTFDVVHDATDPIRLLASIQQALKPDGIYVCLDFNSSEQPEQNFGPIGVMLYASSIFYCMTTSLAEGGDGLGAAGLPEAKLRQIALAAGFATVDRMPIGDPFNNLYEIRP